MSASQATTGYGLSFTFGGAALAEVNSIDGPGVARDKIDVSTLFSPSAFKEFIAGMIDGGEITTPVNYCPQNTVHKAILAALVAVPQTPTAFTLVLTDSGASVLSGNLLVLGFDPKSAVGTQLQADFKYQCTGPVTFPS